MLLYLKLFENFQQHIKYKYYRIYSYQADGYNPELYTQDNDYDYIKHEFDSLEEKDLPYYHDKDEYDKPYFTLDEITGNFEFVYDLNDDETIYDYPISDYYDDKVYYKQVDYEIETLDTKYFDSEIEYNNKIKDKIHVIKEDVSILFTREYHDYIHHSESGGYLKTTSYYFLVVDKNGKLIKKQNEKLFSIEKDYSDSEFSNRTSIIRNYINYNENNYIVQVRIGDHSQNEDNIDDVIDFSISVVVCFENETAKDFETKEDTNIEDVYDKNDFFDDLDLDSKNNNYTDSIFNDIKYHLNRVELYLPEIKDNRIKK